MNKLGPVDVYIVSHHGWSQSNSPALLAAITPRLSIMDNGENKGGTPSSWDIIHSAPKLEDFWQLHYSKEGGAAHNSPDPLIANLQGTDPGNYLKLRCGSTAAGSVQFADTGFETLHRGTLSAGLSGFRDRFDAAQQKT